jgi:hypothetical protein
MTGTSGWLSKDGSDVSAMIGEGQIPGSAQELAIVIAALPDFADRLVTWFAELGEFMAEAGIQDTIRDRVDVMAANARVIKEQADEAAPDFDRAYNFWISYED